MQTHSQTLQIQIPNSLLQKVDSLLQKVETLEQSLSLQTPAAEPNYIPRLKLAERLQISIGTLHNWTCKGVLTAHQIGGKIYYKLDEVEAAMVELK
ncbi:helix-turn-helix domain-containing protein [Algibacter lectus]|uniref:Helix-turn-helix protein n=1 Tax=Algibacter lectus TaxID=221126 RepID=A0A4R8M911_9FLAO|nr:helix-turn-helix domain-containing protein [Algibacter lectus]MWW24034.1 helix-turn-helix domain-containing protein [Algibacter lectus]TDY62050.1 helix-turn-helix protein [Algibacter lectus]